MNHNLPPKSLDCSIVVECELDEPPEKVWRALTVPEILAAWLMPNDMRPEVGNRFTLEGENARWGDIACEILAVEPNRFIRFSWRGECDRCEEGRQLDTVVTFELTETETGGTHLRLVHGGFPTTARVASTASLAPTRAFARRPPLSAICAARRRGVGRAMRLSPMLTNQWSLRWAA